MNVSVHGPSGGLEEEHRGDLWTEDTALSWCERGGCRGRCWVEAADSSPLLRCPRRRRQQSRAARSTIQKLSTSPARLRFAVLTLKTPAGCLGRALETCENIKSGGGAEATPSHSHTH